MASNDDPTELSERTGATEAETQRGAENRRKELDDLRWMLGHPQGRRVARRLFERTGLHKTSFHSSGSVMSFNEGQRNVGLWWLAELSAAAPDGFHKVLPETKQ